LNEIARRDVVIRSSPSRRADRVRVQLKFTGGPLQVHLNEPADGGHHPAVAASVRRAEYRHVAWLFTITTTQSRPRAGYAEALHTRRWRGAGARFPA
jgi:hypothetical protein